MIFIENFDNLGRLMWSEEAATKQLSGSPILLKISGQTPEK